MHRHPSFKRPRFIETPLDLPGLALHVTPLEHYAVLASIPFSVENFGVFMTRRPAVIRATEWLIGRLGDEGDVRRLLRLEPRSWSA